MRKKVVSKPTCAFCCRQCRNNQGCSKHENVCQKKKFHCEQCRSRFKNATDLKRHIKSKHHECEICRKYFNSYHTLLKHKFQVHKKQKSSTAPAVDTEIDSSSLEDLSFVCIRCNAIFFEKEAMRSHGDSCTVSIPSHSNNHEHDVHTGLEEEEVADGEENDVGNMSFVCLRCNAIFLEKEAMHSHGDPCMVSIPPHSDNDEYDVHTGVEEEEVDDWEENDLGNVSFVCLRCNEIFNEKEAIRSHSVSCTVPFPLSEYEIQARREEHEGTDGRAIKCVICEHEALLPNLRLHIALHTISELVAAVEELCKIKAVYEDEEQRLCEICGIFFKSQEHHICPSSDEI